MYNLGLDMNEGVLIIDNDAKMKENNRYVDVAAVLTNKRLIILKDINKHVDSFDFLRISPLPEYEIVMEMDIEDIKDITEEKVYLKDEKVIDLISEEINAYLFK